MISNNRIQTSYPTVATHKKAKLFGTFLLIEVTGCDCSLPPDTDMRPNTNNYRSSTLAHGRNLT